METSIFKNLFSHNTYENQDVLSVFKFSSVRNTNIRQGMSMEEISEVVSEKLLSVVKEQFEVTKAIFESNQNIKAESQN